MQTVPVSSLVLFAFLYPMSSAAAQPPVGALAVDERQGERYGWAVDYETAGAAQSAALGECGGGCRVVLTFERCAAYAADQDADSTAVGWSESYGSAAAAQQAALSECSSRGGSGCIVRVWGCNGPAVEEGLGLDVASRQRIQRGLRAAGFDPGGADGLFGPRTRAAIRGWQSSRGSRATGYLAAASAAALRSAAAGPAVAAAAPPAVQPGLQPGATVTWTGECIGGLAQGSGTLAWVWDGGNEQTDIGRLQDGRHNGHWVIRLSDGGVAEGPVDDSKLHGDWVIRYPDGRVTEQRFENGERVDRRASLAVMVLLQGGAR